MVYTEAPIFSYGWLMNSFSPACFSFVNGKWDHWAKMRSYFYNHSVFDSQSKYGWLWFWG